MNLKYCGEPKCKFMFVYTLFREQETRLNLHFSSLARLGIFLNRTLVLMNVGHSEMNAYSDFPFEFYYDIKQLKKKIAKFTYERCYNSLNLEPIDYKKIHANRISLAYAKHIIKASSRVVNRLKPFIVIHWEWKQQMKT
nr:11327_t:CDS:2 [Entrophospora candida]